MVKTKLAKWRLVAAAGMASVMIGGSWLVAGTTGVQTAEAQQTGQITLSAAPNPVTQGQNFVVTITVSPAAEGFTSIGFSLPVPAGTTGVSCTPVANCNLSGNNFIFGIISGTPLTANQVFTATFTANTPGTVSMNPTGNECIGADSFTEIACPDTPIDVTINAGGDPTPPTATNTVPAPTATNTTVPPTATNTVPSSPGVISFVSSSSSVNESNPGSKSVPVQRTGGTSGTVSAVCTFTNTGTALNGSDFTATVNQTLTWTNGDFSNKTCNYVLNQDTLIEGPETIILQLSDLEQNNLARQVVSPTTHTVTINDDDFEVPPTQIGGVQTVVPTIPNVATPPMPTNTTFPTNTPKPTNTVKPTDTALPTNTSSAQTNTPTSTPTKPATTASNTAAPSNTTGTGGSSATPRPPSSGTGTNFGGTNTLAALLLVAIGLGVSGFAATRVTRKG